MPSVWGHDYHIPTLQSNLNVLVIRVRKGHCSFVQQTQSDDHGSKIRVISVTGNPLSTQVPIDDALIRSFWKSMLSKMSLRQLCGKHDCTRFCQWLNWFWIDTCTSILEFESKLLNSSCNVLLPLVRIDFPKQTRLTLVTKFTVVLETTTRNSSLNDCQSWNQFIHFFPLIVTVEMSSWKQGTKFPRFRNTRDVSNLNSVKKKSESTLFIQFWVLLSLLLWFNYDLFRSTR